MTPEEFKSIVTTAQAHSEHLSAASLALDTSIRQMEASARALFDDLWQQAFGPVHVRYFAELRSGFGSGYWKPEIVICQVAGLSWTTAGWYKGFVADNETHVAFPFEDAQPEPLVDQALALFCEKASRMMGIQVKMKHLEARTWHDYFDLKTIPAMFPQRKVEMLLTGEIDRGRFDDDVPDSFALFSMDGELMIALQHGEDYCTYVFDSSKAHEIDEAFEWLAEDVQGRWGHMRAEYHDMMLANWAAIDEAKEC